MSNEEVYFNNHSNAVRWPFTIYHKPIEDKFLELIGTHTKEKTCLNIGCGFFGNYPSFKNTQRLWHACDIDPRCLDVVNTRYPEIETKLCHDFPPYDDESFDIIVSSEVIEHIPDAKPWLQRVYSLLKPGGISIMSTPNYGGILLPSIEYTFLEIVARLRGFTRFGIHTNKYSETKLFEQLKATSQNDDEVFVEKCSWGMVLIGVIKKAA